MFRLAALAILLLSTTDWAHAAAGCPSGYTPQDGVCKPYIGPNTPTYGRRRYYDEDYGYRRRKPCPDGYTVQGGVCKPYLGPNVPNYYYR